MPDNIDYFSNQPMIELVPYSVNLITCTLKSAQRHTNVGNTATSQRRRDLAQLLEPPRFNEPRNPPDAAGTKKPAFRGLSGLPGTSPEV